MIALALNLRVHFCKGVGLRVPQVVSTHAIFVELLNAIRSLLMCHVYFSSPPNVEHVRNLCDIAATNRMEIAASLHLRFPSRIRAREKRE